MGFLKFGNEHEKDVAEWITVGENKSNGSGNRKLRGSLEQNV